MDPVGPDIHFLNVQYFFRLIYETSLGRPDLSDLALLAANIWIIVTVLGYLLTVVFIGMLMHYTTRIYQVREAEKPLYATASHEQLDDETDHSRWAHVKQLIESIVPTVRATNEPKRQSCGAPDYIVTRAGIPLGYIEAKDVGLNLSDKKHQSQFNRYKNSLDNLIITNYLDFELFINSNNILIFTLITYLKHL